MKLFPILAKTLAFSITSEHVRLMYVQLIEDIKTYNFSKLDILHHYLSGMKSHFTQETMDAMICIR
jgi:hypothetical protein